MSIELMRQTVDGWCARIEARAQPNPAAVNHHDGAVVVLTGATGGVGAHLLAQFSSCPDVSKVICLSRAKSHAESLDRVTASLGSRALSADMTKVVSYAGDANQPLLGLTPAEYADVRDSVTVVIHLAWPVNFRMALSRYEEHFEGVINLINLTLASPRNKPAAFFFATSICSIGGFSSDTIIEENFMAPEGAIMGYGKSKWIVEEIIKRTGSVGRLSVFRIGQVSGDTVHGIWNEADTYPLMFRSGNVLGVLPLMGDRIDWLPLDTAARCMVEIAAATETLDSLQSPHAEMYNVLNPRICGWDTVLLGLWEGGFEFQAVPYMEWVQRLANSRREGNPAHKLLSFFQSPLAAMAQKTYRFDKTTKLSPTLATCPAVDVELMAKYTRNWIQTGFLAGGTARARL